MKRLLKRFIAIPAAIMLIMILAAPQVSAAATVTMSGGDNVKGGDTFYVAVTFGGGDVGRVDAQITYDTGKLTYISGGTSTGNAGYINLSKAGTEGSVTFNIKFQAVSDGSTTLQLTTYDLFDLDEMPMGENPSASKTINISGNAGNDQVITQETSPDEPEEPTQLSGVDEKEEESGGNTNITVILIVSAAILVILIVIVSVVLARKKGKKKDKNKNSDKNNKAAYVKQPQQEPYQEPQHARDDGYWMDDLMGSGNVNRQNDHRKTYKKRAREETEFFDDWQIQDDDNKDQY